MDKSMKLIEMLTKKGKSYKTAKYAIVTEYLFVPEIWDEIKAYLITFNPKMIFYSYSFAQTIEEDNDDDNDELYSIREITFNVCDFSKFSKKSKCHLILTDTQDTTSDNEIINYKSRVEFVDKDINELNLQLGYVYKNILSNPDGNRNVLTEDDFNYGCDGITTDNKIKYEFFKWKHEIQIKTDYKFLKKFLLRRSHPDKIICVDNYLKHLLKQKYKL